MIIDTRKLLEGQTIEASVCVIGGGVAGISLALEFEKLGIDCCILESGGLGPDEETRDLYRGESVGLRYHFADGCRSRFLGGSSNCWGGFCRMFDEHDFEKREWIPDSGWPISRHDLEPYYVRSQRVLNLGPYNYEVGSWVAAIGRNDVRRLPLPTGRVRDAISQFSLIPLGKLYREALDRSERIRVYLYANAADIETDAAARHVRGIRVATLTGRRVYAKARVFVLAAGGIENARLLLVSNKTQPAGLGNGNDLVGRYFMDHPRLYSGSITLNEPWSRNKLFDIKFDCQNPTVSAFGTQISGQFSLSPKTQRAERITNAQIWFSSVFPGEYTEAAEALVRMKRRWGQKEEQGPTLMQDLLTLAKEPLNTAGFALARLFHPRALIKTVRFQAIAEPEPDRDARVTLSCERDKLGLHRVRVNWRLGPIVRRTFDRNFAILADELQRAGVATVTLDPPIEHRSEWPESLHHEGTWHHMGTTRMHESPKQGVVDRNGLVHGMSNLYVAGSSVFTTAGANFPTMTLVALALRLADHLALRLRTPSEAVIHPIRRVVNEAGAVSG